jgi:hypothetical protein
MAMTYKNIYGLWVGISTVFEKCGHFLFKGGWDHHVQLWLTYHQMKQEYKWGGVFEIYDHFLYQNHSVWSWATSVALLSHLGQYWKIFSFYMHFIRSPESLRWPIAIRFRLSSSVVRRSSVVNFWTSLEPLNQFQPDLAYSIYGWRGTKIVKFMAAVPLGPWGGAKTTPNWPIFKNLLLYNRTCGGKTECIVM